MIFFRQVDCGGCAPCPTGPCEPSTPASPMTEARTASASLSKCGWDEWPGYVSTPPKIYLTRTLSGTITYTYYVVGSDCTDCTRIYAEIYSGSAIYDSQSCQLTSSATLCEKLYENDCNTLQSTECVTVNDVIYDSYFLNESFSSITHTVSGIETCVSPPSPLTGPDIEPTGSAYAVLSSEYTTALLLSNVASSIPAFSGAYHTYNPANDYAYYDLSTDEITATETKLQYRFALPSLTGYTCYRITWSEKFVPESGSVVYTAKSYTWDGSATYAGPYTIDPPASQGTTTVVSVMVSCTGC